MDFFKKINKGFIILFAIVLLGFVLRYHNLYTWPRHGATFDEFAWPWLGINLIQTGVPVSWSSQPQYDNREHLIYQGAAFWIVTPYLEHPPLFGLVAGVFALINGATNMYDVTLGHIRPFAVMLGLITIILVFMLTKEVYDKKTAYFAALLYATIPTVVVGSRILQNENFFIPVWLFSILLISKFVKTKNSLYRNIAAILCGLLILAKIPWIAAAGSVVLIFLFLKRYRDVYKFLLIVVPVASLFVVYGFYYDSDLFIRLWGLQLARYDLDFSSIYALFQKPFLIDRYMTDGWIIFGWIAFFMLLTQDIKKNYLVVLPALAYFVIFLAGIPDETGHGWYRYPFYPFLIIAIAVFINQHFNKNSILTFLFLVIVGFSLINNSWVNFFGFSYFVFRVTILMLFISLIPIFLPFKKLAKISKISTFGMFGILILLNIWTVLQYNEQ